MPDTPANELFSLKEWMSAISAKLDRMDTKLDGKAELLQVREVEVRLGILEKQAVEAQAEAKFLMPQHMRLVEDVDGLKRESAGYASVDTYKRWLFGVATVAIIDTAVVVAKLLVR